MSSYADKLHQAFNDAAQSTDKTAENLRFAYEDSYVFLTEAFETCKNDIYTNNDGRSILLGDVSPENLIGKVVTPEDLLGQPDDFLDGDLEESTADYFEVINILAHNPPENFGLDQAHMDDLSQTFKEAILLARDHMDQHFCYRPLKGPVFGAYIDAEQMTRDLLRDLL